MKKAAALLAALTLVAWGMRGRWPHRKAAGTKQLEILKEILASRNDNDPRLDRDFKTLSPEAKRLFRQEYRRIPPERRNERGTIVYLLGRNPLSPEDWAFFRDVVSEPPCLSLANCARKMSRGEQHGMLGLEVTLAYPQLVALKQVERAIEEARRTGGQSSGEALRVIKSAANSQAPVVAKMAAELARRF